MHKHFFIGWKFFVLFFDLVLPSSTPASSLLRTDVNNLIMPFSAVSPSGSIISGKRSALVLQWLE